MVKIKQVHMVRPASCETPTGMMYLSEFDQASPITHAPTIYIYRRPATNQPFETLVQTLITSLSQTLVDFYPLAGRLHYIPNAGERLELECNGEGVEIIEAESELRVEDLGDFSPSPVISSFIPKVDYVNKPIYEIPLVLMQVTSLRCGGITVGLAVSHTMFDGQGALLFISEWSKRARGVVDPVKPFLDRTILKSSALRMETDKVDDDTEHIDYSPPPLLVGRTDNKEERAKETAVATFKLSAEQVAELKSKANMDIASGVRGRPYSRYEAIAAHMWRCSTKARNHTAEQPTRLRFPINARNRLKPSLPPTYIGNAVIPKAVDTTSSELLNNPLSHICSLIRHNVTIVDDKYVRNSLIYLEKQPDVTQFRNFHSLGCTVGGFFGNPTFVITSWLSLPLYGTDFGWGPEDYMGPGGMGFDGKCFVLPGHDEDGSVLVFLRLQVEFMDEFKKCFYEDI